MSLRRALVGLLPLVVALGLVAAGGSAEAVTWTQVDRSCVSNTSGTLCVTTYKSSDGWKGTASVAVASGHWMKFTSVAMSHGTYGGSYCDDTYGSTPCPARVTTSKTLTYTGSTQVVLIADVATDTAKLSTAAGRTDWERHAARCATVTQGTACVSAWYQMRRLSFYYKTRASVAPAAGRTMTPLDTRLALYYTVYPSTTVQSVARSTTFDGQAKGTAWAAYGGEVRQPTGSACDHLGGIFHYRSGGVTRSVSVTAPYC